MTSLFIQDHNEFPMAADYIRDIRNTTLVVGMPKDDDHLSMVAIVNEVGTTITARNHPYLVIPTSGANGSPASNIPGLYQRGMTLGVDDKSQSNGYRVCFILKKSVKIPPRPFMRLTLNNHGDDWTQAFRDAFLTHLFTDHDAKAVFKAVGDVAVKDMKDTISKLSMPANAPLTVERKGFDNPLIDTKHMLNSVCWFVLNNRR